MPEAVLKVSKGMLEALLLPTGTIIEEVVDTGRGIECKIRGPAVPEGCEYVRAVKSEELRLVSC